MTLEEALQYLLGGGALAVASWFASWFLEEFAWWHALASKVKSSIILAISIAIGAIALLLQSRPDWVAALEPFAQFVFIVLSAWLATQVAHKVGKALDSRADGDVTLIDAQVETVEVEVDAPAYRGGSGAG